MKVLRTWGGKGKFRYRGSVSEGTDIEYGAEFRSKQRVSRAQYRDLLRHFSNKEVSLGTSHDNPRSVAWVRG